MGKSVSKAIIPAAGLGTRLLPLTRSVPKELLPVGSFPMIHRCVEEAALSGIREIIIVIREGKESIRHYFLDEFDGDITPGHPLEQLKRLSEHIDFTFVYQKSPRGPGDALRKAGHLLQDRPFALMYPDDVFIGRTPALKQLVDVFEVSGEMVTGLIKLDNAAECRFGNCGRVDIEPVSPGPEETGGVYKIRKLYDKERGLFTVKEQGEIRWTGRHVLEPSFLEHLERLDRGEGELDDVGAFQGLIGDGSMLGKLIESEVFDVGNMKGYLHAHMRLAALTHDGYFTRDTVL